MRFIVECDGPIFDVVGAYYAAHVRAAKESSWARLDQARFFRMMKKEGLTTHVLPGAPAGKVNEYHRRLAEALESSDVVRHFAPHEEVKDSLTGLKRFGSICLLTLGRDVETRWAMAEEAGLRGMVESVERLNDDPRRRAGELKALSKGEARGMVVGCSDTLIRAADEAELFTVGLTCGACDESRLHRAGARAVRRDLSALAEELRQGAGELIRLGLPPRPLG